MGFTYSIQFLKNCKKAKTEEKTKQMFTCPQGRESLFGFSSESLVFCEQKSDSLTKKERFALLSWAPERICHGHSFVLRDLNNLLTVALFKERKSNFPTLLPTQLQLMLPISFWPMVLWLKRIFYIIFYIFKRYFLYFLEFEFKHIFLDDSYVTFFNFEKKYFFTPRYCTVNANFVWHLK